MSCAQQNAKSHHFTAVSIPVSARELSLQPCLTQGKQKLGPLLSPAPRLRSPGPLGKVGSPGPRVFGGPSCFPCCPRQVISTCPTFLISPFPLTSNIIERCWPWIAFWWKKKDQLLPFSDSLNLIRLILHLPRRHTKKINVTSSHRRLPLGPVGVSNYFHYWATSRIRIKGFNYWPYSGGEWQEDGYLATSRGQHGILIAAFGREYKKGCQEQINSECGALQQPAEPQGSVMKSAPRVHRNSGDARFWATCTSASPKIEQLSIRRQLCTQNFPFHSPRFNPS